MKTENKETPQWIFWLVGSFIIFISIVARLIDSPTWQLISDVALNIGISVIAVSIIDWVWRRVGGDPMMNAITELRSATILLSDLHNSGIKRVFISRTLASDHKRLLLEKMARAREVDMIGIALRSGWVSTPEFQTILKEQARRNRTNFRIAVFDPESAVVAQRTLEEDGKPNNRIADSAASTLRILINIRNSLHEKDQDALKIRVVRETGLYCSIIRVDDSMMITKYLLHLSGGSSETLIIDGKDTSYFKLYIEEFRAVWDKAADWPS